MPPRGTLIGVRIRLLGPVDVLVDGAPRPVPGLRRKAVLAVLALRRGEVVASDRLADAVWGEAAPPTVVNTLLFVGLGVNLMLFAAVLLSGLFMRRDWWVRALLAVYLLSWALPEIPSFVSFHWMLIGEQGLVDSLLRELFGLEGPIWFNDQSLALG